MLYEQALVPVRMRHPAELRRVCIRGLQLMNEDFLRYGITSATDASGRNSGSNPRVPEGRRPRDYSRCGFTSRFAPAAPSIRLGEHYLQSGLVTGYGNEKLRLGSFKLMLDGAGGGGSAAMRQSYPGKPSEFGILHQTQEELDELVLKGHKAGYQIGRPRHRRPGRRDGPEELRQGDESLPPKGLSSPHRALRVPGRPSHGARCERWE